MDFLTSALETVSKHALETYPPLPPPGGLQPPVQFFLNSTTSECQRMLIRQLEIDYSNQLDEIESKYNANIDAIESCRGRGGSDIDVNAAVALAAESRRITISELQEQVRNHLIAIVQTPQEALPHPCLELWVCENIVNPFPSKQDIDLLSNLVDMPAAAVQRYIEARRLRFMTELAEKLGFL